MINFFSQNECSFLFFVFRFIRITSLEQLWFRIYFFRIFFMHAIGSWVVAALYTLKHLFSFSNKLRFTLFVALRNYFWKVFQESSYLIFMKKKTLRVQSAMINHRVRIPFTSWSVYYIIMTFSYVFFFFKNKLRVHIKINY